MKFTNIKRISALAVCGLVSVVFLTQCESVPTTGGDDVQPLELPPDIPKRAGHLVDVREIDPSIVVDLRYGTSDNITGRPLYPPDMPCLLNYATARRLARAQDYLRRRGYGLKVWDAYRPPAVQQKLYDAAPDGEWVAAPGTTWSHHNFGTAVDVTLVDRKGREEIMPSDFDEFNHRASHKYNAGNSIVSRNVLMLQRAMRLGGFEVALDEWWHFYDIWPRDSRLTYASELGIQLPD